MKKIKLSTGAEAIVDDEDYEDLIKHAWVEKKHSHTSYAVRSKYIKGKYKQVRMHRFILNPLPGQHIDHINGNGLDNRKINLRICTNHQNQRNRSKSKNKSSMYKGVSWDCGRNRWLAQIQVNKKTIYLGRFASEVAAAEAYDKAAVFYFKDFAKTNRILFMEKQAA